MTHESVAEERPSGASVDARESEVWESLAPVTDPELDESVTALGFVNSVQVQDETVSIGFHLPTYWCAANFAYMMASDMRQAVQALPWVKSVSVELIEHMYSDTINRGIAASRSFQDTFGDEASDDINVVRETFRKKAFQQRQELLIRYLLAKEYARAIVVSMTMHELDQLLAPDSEGEHLLQRYREIRREWGGAFEPGNSAFVRVDGELLSLESLDGYLSELRSIRINTQFNGQICRGLLDARYGKQASTPSEIRVEFPALEKQQAR